MFPFKLRSSKCTLSPRFPKQNPVRNYPHPIRATCPDHLILLDLITKIIYGKECISYSHSLCNLLHSPVTSSLLGSNISLSTLISNTLSWHTSLNVRDQVSHSCKTTGKIIVLCISIFVFLGSKQGDRSFIYLNINQLDALNFIMSLFRASTCLTSWRWAHGARNM